MLLRHLAHLLVFKMPPFNVAYLVSPNANRVASHYLPQMLCSSIKHATLLATITRFNLSYSLKKYFNSGSFLSYNIHVLNCTTKLMHIYIYYK